MTVKIWPVVNRQYTCDPCGYGPVGITSSSHVRNLPKNWDERIVKHEKVHRCGRCVRENRC